MIIRCPKSWGPMHSFNIFILDDNEIFLRLFHKRIERHSISLELGTDIRIGIHSFSDHECFLTNLNASVDLVFLDYYLGMELNAWNVLEKMNGTTAMPPVIILSATNPCKNMPPYLAEHVEGFVRKDVYLLPKTCLLIQEYLEAKKLLAS